MQFTKSIFENLHSIQATQEGIAVALTDSFIALALVVLPMLAGCFFAALIAEGVQTGFSFTPKALEPKFSKMNPIKE